MSGCFGYPEEDLAKIFYMETVLANLWHLEDGEPVYAEEMETAKMVLKEQQLLRQWQEEEAVAHIHGWDVSHIEGRYTEETDLPWSYRDVILEYLKPEMGILDIDTGGGEFLLSLGHPCAHASAIVGFAPNVALCLETLLSRALVFPPADSTSILPFRGRIFNIVLHRHGDFNAQ